MKNNNSILGIILVLLLIFLSALPVYWGAKRYCKTGSIVELYGIYIGAGILISIFAAVIMSAVMPQSDQQQNT
jgi:amino acid transporter